MSCVAQHDFCRRSGDTATEVIQLMLSGSPVDITGDTFLMRWDSRQNPPEGDVSTQIGTVAGVIVVAANGTVSFAPPDPAVTDLAAGEYFYEIEWTDGGLVRTILGGRWTVI